MQASAQRFEAARYQVGGRNASVTAEVSIGRAAQAFGLDGS